MSKRAWLILVCIVLAATATVGGTLAFLTDRDTVENVFTLGNVDIKIDESFQQNTELYPSVEVIKRAGITNTHATEPAYVWMVVSVPDALAKYITLGWNGYTPVDVTSPHEGYKGYLVTYPEVLTAGSSTGDILESISLSPYVDYQGGEYVAVVNGNVTPIYVDGQVKDQQIIVDAYAIQTDGFADVNAAYGGYTGQWGGLKGGDSGYVKPGPQPEVLTAYSEEQLQTFINGATKDTVIILASSIKGNITVPQNPDVNITIRGDGATFEGVLMIDGKSKQYKSAGLTIDNVHFKADELPAGTNACINMGDGRDETRYICNLTVRNCTFDFNGYTTVAAIRTHTGGDRNLQIINCTVTERMHSLCQLHNVEAEGGGVVVDNCIIKSKNGMSFGQSEKVTIRGCTVDVPGYAVRFGDTSGGEGYAEEYLIENCSLKSANDDSDTVIFLRKTADNATLNINNTQLIPATAGLEIKNTATDAKVYINGVLQ